MAAMISAVVMVMAAAGAPAPLGCPRPDPTLAALEALADRPDASIGEVQQAFERFYDHPCHQAAVTRPIPDSVAAFRDWWRGNAAQWLAWVTAPNREVMVPPDMRPTLSADRVPETLRHRSGWQALPPALFCPRAAACDPETIAWMADAELAMEPRPRRTRSSWPRSDPGPCRPLVARLPVAQQFRGFVECVSQLRDETPRFPAGSFRGPSSGWMVLRIGPGHRWVPETLAAFDLQTGSAVLVSAGDQGRPRTIVGRVAAGLARQTLFLMAMRGQVTPGSARTRRYEAPAGAPVAWWRDENFQVSPSGGLEGGIAGSSPVGWAWVDDAVLAGGEFSLPDSPSEYERYLGERFALLEDAVVEECPARLPPASAAAAVATSPSGAPQTRWPALQQLWRAALARSCSRR
jgi:hypothetical protein